MPETWLIKLYAGTAVVPGTSSAGLAKAAWPTTAVMLGHCTTFGRH